MGKGEDSTVGPPHFCLNKSGLSRPAAPASDPPVTASKSCSELKCVSRPQGGPDDNDNEDDEGGEQRSFVRIIIFTEEVSSSILKMVSVRRSFMSTSSYSRSFLAAVFYCYSRGWPNGKI